MRPRRRVRLTGANEHDAERAAEAVPARAPSRGPSCEPRDEGSPDAALDGARLHRDERAAALTEALGAQAVTVGRHVYLSPRTPPLDSDAGRRLLAHELTHVVQQDRFGPRLQRFTAGERPLIAKDLSAMMSVITALVTASSPNDGQINMDLLVKHAGGQPAGAAAPGPTGRDVAGMLPLRYLFTRRAGLVDMRHFIQLMYISWFFNAGAAATANRAATRMGIEHEQGPDRTSRYAPEDLTSNALGAWTGTRLTGLPQRDGTIAAIRETLQRCAPVDFMALSAASRTAVVDFYAAQSGGEPLNQNRTAVALIPTVPELAGTDRSFPFELDADDAHHATISGPAFDTGSTGLTGDAEIREFVAVRRPAAR
jgi:Domain of unknown function (DUF4157)